MFTCPLFHEFCELNKPAKLKGVNIDTVPPTAFNCHYLCVGIVRPEFAKIKGSKIILHAKSPTFRAAKLNGFTASVVTDAIVSTSHRGKDAPQNYRRVGNGI